MPITVPPAVSPSSKNIAPRSAAPASSEPGAAAAFPAALERAKRPGPASPNKPEKPVASDKAKSARSGNARKADKSNDDEAIAPAEGKKVKPKTANGTDDSQPADEASASERADGNEQVEDADGDAVESGEQPAAALAAVGLASPAAAPKTEGDEADATSESVDDADNPAVVLDGAVAVGGGAVVGAEALTGGHGGTSDDVAAGSVAGSDSATPDHGRAASPNVSVADHRTPDSTPDASADDVADPGPRRSTPALADALAAPASDAAARAPESAASPPAQPPTAGSATDALGSKLSAFDEMLSGQAAQPTGPAPALASHVSSATPAMPPELRFSETNHANIVSGVQADLMPNGGTMRIRLDPPQLGALQVTVQMRDGVMTASFETSNDEATRLLSHSLTQLKSTLESHGVNVERLQVQQGPRDVQAQAPRDDQQQQQQQRDGQQGQSTRQEQQEQQRREMMRRMWRRLNGRDPLDVTG